MTLKQVLDLLDHEVWVRVRPHGPVRDKPDIVVWSADWIGGYGYPDEVEKYLGCEADDLSVELHPDPERSDELVPMLVVYANMFIEPDPVKVFVLEKMSDYGTGMKGYGCRVFLDKECAKAALRDQYDSEIDVRGVLKPSKKSRLEADAARLEFVNGVTIELKLRELLTEDGDYR